MKERLMNHKINVLKMHHVKEIKKGKVIIENSKFECTEIKADKVLIAVGFTPNNELFTQLEGKIPQIITLGDCKAVGKLFEAIHDGFYAGYQL